MITGRMAAGLAAGVILAFGLDGATCAAATTTPPPPRAPEQKRVLTDLAYVLGETHALHRLCAGPSDGFWYERMTRLLSIEQPEGAFRQLLIDRFNAGFIAAGSEFTNCSQQSRDAGKNAAERGRTLSESLVSDPPGVAATH